MARFLLQPHPWTVAGQPQLYVDLAHPIPPDDVPPAAATVEVPELDQPCELCGRPLADPLHHQQENEGDSRDDHAGRDDA